MEGLYESEICQQLQAVRDQLEDEPFDEVKLDQTFGQLMQAIKQLEAEARTQADASSRKALQAKVKQYKDDAKAVRAKVRAAKEASERSALMGGGPDSDQVRDRMMGVNQRMEEGASTLERSHRTMLEIEETAAGVAEQLSQNRATLMSTKRKLDETNSLGGRATQLLRSLERNQRFKTLFAYGAMGIVAFALLFLLYTMFFGLS